MKRQSQLENKLTTWEVYLGPQTNKGSIIEEPRWLILRLPDKEIPLAPIIRKQLEPLPGILIPWPGNGKAFRGYTLKRDNLFGYLILAHKSFWGGLFQLGDGVLFSQKLSHNRSQSIQQKLIALSGLKARAPLSELQKLGRVSKGKIHNLDRVTGEAISHLGTSFRFDLGPEFLSITYQDAETTITEVIYPNESSRPAI